MIGQYSSLRLFTVIAIILLTFGSAQAADTPRPNSSAADSEFARTMARISTVEIAESTLALTHTKRGDIHDFAQNLLNERTAANTDLARIAAGNGIRISTDISKPDQQGIDRLAELRDEAFERQYITDEMSAIRSELMGASAESRTGVNSGLQYFATRRLPPLLDDRRMIQQIAAGSTVGVPPSPPPLGWQYQPPPLPH